MGQTCQVGYLVQGVDVQSASQETLAGHVLYSDHYPFRCLEFCQPIQQAAIVPGGGHGQREQKWPGPEAKELHLGGPDAMREVGYHDADAQLSR
jgi:hypothetical protein